MSVPFLHNYLMVMLSAGDLGLELDFGRNEPGDILQRWERDSWRSFKMNGKLVRSPFDYQTLPPGRYRLQSK